MLLKMKKEKEKNEAGEWILRTFCLVATLQEGGAWDAERRTEACEGAARSVS